MFCVEPFLSCVNGSVNINLHVPLFRELIWMLFIFVVPYVLTVLVIQLILEWI